MHAIRPAVCERSRSYVSLRLDGELAELEQRMLNAHLLECAGCRAYAADVGAATRAVRATPLAGLSRPLAPRLRHARPVRVRHVAAVAAGFLVVVTSGSIVGRGGERAAGTASSAAWPTPKRYLSDQALLQEQSLLALTRPGSPLPQLRF